MSKSSCIAHPPSTSLIITRQDYLNICDGNRCAADLLSLLEYWTNVKIAAASQIHAMNLIKENNGDKGDEITLWVWKTNSDFRNDLMNVYSEHPVRNGLKILEDKGFISVRTNPNPLYHFDRTLQYLLNVAKVQSAIDDSSANKSAVHHAEVRDTDSRSAEAIPKDTKPKYTDDIYAIGFSTELQVDQIPVKTSEASGEMALTVKVFSTEDASKEKEIFSAANITSIKPVMPGTPRPVEQTVKLPRKKSIEPKDNVDRFELWLSELLDCLGKSELYNPSDSRKVKLSMFGHEMSAVSNILVAVDRINEVRSKSGLEPIDSSILQEIKQAAMDGKWENVTAAAYERHFPSFAMKPILGKKGNEKSHEVALKDMLERAERQRLEDEAFRANRKGKTIAETYRKQ
jgi:hypothetical protein